jgi:phosphoglycerate kinase
MNFGTIGSLEGLRGTTLLRLDLNSPIDPETNLILDDKRFREHIPTISALEDTKCIIISHQSRPGKKDFTTLEGHAEKLRRLVDRPVFYVDDIFGRCSREAVRSLAPGEILLLENLRFNAEENLKMSGEEAMGTHLVRNLSSMADIFVNDAFGTAHRSQPSMVGLPLAMRSVAGLLMEKEVTSLSRVFEGAPGPITFVLGGTKVDDSLDVAENVLDNGIADLVVVVGVVANVFLLAEGRDIGGPSRKLIEKLGYVPDVEKARALLARHRDAILMPEHVALRNGTERLECEVDRIPPDLPIYDLGLDSVVRIAVLLRDSGTVVLNGPAGVFEDDLFATGTYEILKAAGEASFSVVGGGHTAAVIDKLGIEKKFSHISTGGGACIEFLTGKKLPAVAALEASREIFG